MDNQDKWNEAWKEYRKFNYSKLNKIYDYLQIDRLPRDAIILDLGCGTGEFINILLENGFQNIEGFELDNKLVEQANKPYIKQGNCLEIPATKEKYDAITMIGVLHHLHSMEEVLKTLSNVQSMLKPGGEFYSIEPRNSLARMVMTQLMFALPMAILPARVKIDRILINEEKIEMNNWLKYEHKIPSKTYELGFSMKLKKSDWKSVYHIWKKFP